MKEVKVKTQVRLKTQNKIPSDHVHKAHMKWKHLFRLGSYSQAPIMYLQIVQTPDFWGANTSSPLLLDREIQADVFPCHFRVTLCTLGDFSSVDTLPLPLCTHMLISFFSCHQPSRFQRYRWSQIGLWAFLSFDGGFSLVIGFAFGCRIPLVSIISSALQHFGEWWFYDVETVENTGLFCFGVLK